MKKTKEVAWKFAKWLINEVKWFAELAYLHVKVFLKENDEVFGRSLRGIAYRLVFSFGLGTLLAVWSFYAYSAYRVVMLEMPETKIYLASKVLKPKVIYVENVSNKVQKNELSGNSGQLQTVSEMENVKDEEEKKYVGNFSAYNTVVGQTDSSPFTTADGTDTRVYKGCIVAHNDLPFNTVIEIDGIGECTVKDRMNKRYTGKAAFDICMRMDIKGAKLFGRKSLEYTIK